MLYFKAKMQFDFNWGSATDPARAQAP